jgi:hypothetical protein
MQNLAYLCLETRKRFQNGQNSGSLLSSSPSEGGFCSSETKHSRTRVVGTKLFVWAVRLQERMLQTRKMSWVRVPEKMLGLGIICSCDIQRYVSNDQAYDKVSGSED